MAITITNGAGLVKVEFKRKIEEVTKPFRVMFNKDSKRIYIHTDKHEGHRQGKTDIFIDWNQVTSPVTADPETLRDLLATYSAEGSSGAGTANGTFTNADLTAGVLTIAHNLNSTSIGIVIRDPVGLETSQPNTVVDANNVTVDFGGAIGAGTYTWVAFSS